MSNLILGSSNKDYHSNVSHLSSSSLKLLLKDSAKFEQEYILGIKDRIEKDSFTEGSLVHTLILEPEKIGEYAVYPGLVKRGKVFEEFKKENSDKVIISAGQMLRCEKLIKGYNRQPLASQMLSSTIREHNMVAELCDVPVKARADAIDTENGRIYDVKTTWLASDIDMFKFTVEDYMYHLSAALYCQIASIVYARPFEFYWIVISKEDGQCHIYKASPDTLSKGNALVVQALVKYKKCKESGIWLDGAQQMEYDSKTDYEIQEV